MSRAFVGKSNFTATFVLAAQQIDEARRVEHGFLARHRAVDHEFQPDKVIASMALAATSGVRCFTLSP